MHLYEKDTFAINLIILLAYKKNLTLRIYDIYRIYIYRIYI